MTTPTLIPVIIYPEMRIKESDYFPIYLLGVLSGVIFSIAMLVSFQIDPDVLGDVKLEYVDLVVVVLASVTVIVTVLAVFIAILAIWGYSQFEKMTKNASEAHVEAMLIDGPLSHRIDDMVVEHVSKQLKDGELRDLLTARIDQILISDADTRSKNVDTQTNEQRYED